MSQKKITSKADFPECLGAHPETRGYWNFVFGNPRLTPDEEGYKKNKEARRLFLSGYDAAVNAAIERGQF